MIADYTVPSRKTRALVFVCSCVITATLFTLVTVGLPSYEDATPVASQSA